MFPCLDLESTLCRCCRTNDDVTYLLLHCPANRKLYLNDIELSIALGVEMGTFL